MGITASANVNLTDTIINASDDVSISSGGSLSINEDRTSFASNFSDGVDIYGGNMITMTALSATIQQASLYSQSDLDITATDGNLTAEDAYMASYYGNINLSAENGTLTLEEGPVSQGVYIEAGDSVSLNGDNSVAISDSTIYADSGTVSITSNGAASGGITIDSSYVESFGNLSITSTGDISLTDDESAYGGVIEGYNGNVTIESTGGTVYADNTEIYANGDINISAGEAISKAGGLPSDSLEVGNSYIESDYGSINLDSAGETFLYDSDVSAGENVTADAQGSLGLQGTYVSAYNTISLTSEQSDVNIGGGTIIAAEGDSLTINAPNGDVNISNGSIIPAVTEAGPGGNPILAVEYTSEGVAQAVIDISDDSDITASGNVYVIANGGEISISGQEVNISDTDFYFGSGITISGSAIASGDGDVDITTEGTLAINGLGTESGNTIYGGAINISDSFITATSGDVNIENQISTITGFTSSGSDIDISDSEITANADLATGLIGGAINISTPGNVDITDSTLAANASVATPSEDDVNITAGGYVNVLDSYSSSDLTANNWDVIGGTYVTMAGDNNLTISGSTITSDGGDVTLRSGTAIITAVPLVDYKLTINDGTQIEASGSVYAYANEGGADIYNSTLTAGTGNVVISASGNADIENTVISADNPSETDYAAGSSVESASIDISSTSGNIDISAGGTVTLTGDTFNLGNDININGTTLTATTGDVDISAGEFNVYGTTINLSDCTFNDGNIDISGTVNDPTTITATLGNVDITAGNNTTIGDATISATPGGTDTDLFNGLDTSSGTLTFTANGGNINIGATEGNVVLNNSTFDLGGNINISDDETVSSTGGDVDITAGELSVSAGGTIDMSGCTITGGQINISEESTVSAGGSVNLNAQAVNIFDSTVTAVNSVNITATGAVDFSSAASPDTSITANGTASGNGITVNAQDGITVSGASLSANTTTGTITLNNGTSGQVVVNNGSTIQTAYLDINSAQGVLIDGTGGRLSGNTMNITTSLGTTADDANNGHTVTVQNADLSGYASMNVQGHTVNLNNDNFSSSRDYNFTSFYHGYYLNNGNVAGYVNFNNDTLNGTTAITGTGPSSTLNPANNGGIELGGTGAGIHVN